jgi:hypothetical protein
MYIRCYDSWADDSTQEQLWLLIKQGKKGWVSSTGVSQCIRWYIPEDLLSFALIIDSRLVPRPKLDYVA